MVAHASFLSPNHSLQRTLRRWRAAALGAVASAKAAEGGSLGGANRNRTALMVLPMTFAVEPRTIFE